jgi:hypothetical protein
VTHALLPAFVPAWRLDAAETIGTVVAGVASGSAGGSAAYDARWKGHLISVGAPAMRSSTPAVAATRRHAEPPDLGG